MSKTSFITVGFKVGIAILRFILTVRVTERPNQVDFKMLVKRNDIDNIRLRLFRDWLEDFV